MFERRTVFIVGAGASAELGLPTGSGLALNIGDKLTARSSDQWTQSLADEELTYALRYMRERLNVGSKIYEAARAIAEAMPQALSIDNFMHTHRNNPDIVQVGKLAIAAGILEAERATELRTAHENAPVDFRQVRDSWHNTFCKMLLENVDRDQPDQIFENVSFITFNYDRCIEHYVAKTLANYLRMTMGEAQTLAGRLQVVHPYGKVGRLHWQDGSDPLVEFGRSPNTQELPDIARAVRTFTEQVDKEAVVRPIQKLISEAEMVVYLGFSYGDMNMELLSLEDVPDKRQIVGTSVGISGPNKKAIERAIVNSMGPQNDVITALELPELACNEMLRAYWKFILKG